MKFHSLCPSLILASSALCLAQAQAQAQTETAKQAVKPLPKQVLSVIQQKTLADAKKLSAQLLKEKAAFHKKVVSGQVDPLSHQRKQLAKTSAAIPQLTQLSLNLKTAKNEEQRVQATDALLLALQPVGQFLQAAEHKPADRSMTAKQAEELKNTLGQRWGAMKNQEKQQKMMQFIGTGLVYTLLDVHVPILLKAKPETLIYLESTTGGKFPNGLPAIKIKANEKGFATTRWVSHGDVVAGNQIHAISSSWNEGSTMHIDVKKLVPQKLPSLKALKESIIQTQKILKKSLSDQK